MKKQFILQVGNGSIVIIRRITQKPEGLVVIGMVTEGEICQGDPVNIPAEGKGPLTDEITRIESFGNEIKKAELGAEIGICLKTTSEETLLQHL